MFTFILMQKLFSGRKKDYGKEQDTTYPSEISTFCKANLYCKILGNNYECNTFKFKTPCSSLLLSSIVSYNVHEILSKYCHLSKFI